jgi:CspA family cold shock protein
MSGRNFGYVEWFNKKRGYGFLINMDDNDKQIFVHHTTINPLTECYKMLYTGEYVEFSIEEGGKNGVQATNVTGPRNGKLRCDVNEEMKNSRKNFKKE